MLRRNVMVKCPQRLNVMAKCRCDAVTPSEPPECDAVGHTTLTTFPHNVLPAVPDSRPQQRQDTALLTCEFFGQATHKSGQFPLPWCLRPSNGTREARWWLLGTPGRRGHDVCASGRDVRVVRASLAHAACDCLLLSIARALPKELRARPRRS